MLQFDNITYEHLATFQSEWIGIVRYYFCTMDCEGRKIRYCIKFDGEDLAEQYEDEEITESMIDDFASELACSNAEVHASNRDIQEVIKSANSTIDEYNNGARFLIADNYDMDDMADDVRNTIGEDLIADLKKECDNQQQSLWIVNPKAYNDIDFVIENYCSEHDLFIVDTQDIFNLL